MTTPASVSVEGFSLYTAAHEALDAVVNAAQLLLVDIPTRRYVTTGEPVFDCEQVVVAINNIETGLPGANTSRTIDSSQCQTAWSVSLTVSIVRHGPKLKQNKTMLVKDMDDAVKSQSADAQVLRDAMAEIISTRIGELSGAITVQGPMGNFVATVADITMAL